MNSFKFRYIILLLFILGSKSNAFSQVPVYTDTTFAEVCMNEYYYDTKFDSVNIDTMAVYGGRDNLMFMPRDTVGEDSIFFLSLSFNAIYNDTIEADICKGSIYSENGFLADTTGLYTNTFSSYLGCDSIVNLLLRVHEPYYDTIYDTICNQQEYGDGFDDADTTGTFVQNLKTYMGCDSVLVLHLHAHPTYSDTIKADIYKGAIYFDNGFLESETGLYERNLLTYLGCDSTIILDLQVDNIVFSNSVTPNGDGKNDIFIIHNLVEQEAFPDNELIIFSRQGNIVYQVRNIREKEDFWDPAKENNPSGTYFFIFKGKRPDKELEFTGAIEVLR